MKIIIENIRTFFGPHEITIKPLTILTGENSSGKTTFLSVVAAMGSKAGYPFRPNFNIKPFELGNFNTVVSNKRNYFRIGIEEEDKYKQLATYVSNSGQIELSEFYAESSTGKLTLTVSSGLIKGTIEFTEKNSNNELFEIEGDLPEEENTGLFPWLLSRIKVNPEKTPDFFGRLHNFSFNMSYYLPTIVPASPIRTKPERTYDRFVDAYDPEGDHIPYILNKLFSKKNKTKPELELIKNINDFGIESGLFTRVKPKKFGLASNDPFALQISVAGLRVNIKDVGYGVSQALPIIVQSLIEPETNQVLLLQQPEVHLHPKAQAALGSFFTKIANKSKRKFIIETHSDYILDRIRQEIASEKILSSEVAIVYLEKQKMATTAHQISIDQHGNILNVPANYREFFLREEINLLKRNKKHDKSNS